MPCALIDARRAGTAPRSGIGWGGRATSTCPPNACAPAQAPGALGIGAGGPEGDGAGDGPYNPPVHLSLVFHAFLARMAVGTLIALLPLARVRPAERHMRFQLLLALCLAGGAAALYGPALGGAQPHWPRGTDALLSLQGAIPGALVLLCVLCLVSNAAFGTFRRPAGRAALVLAVLAGLVAVWGSARLGPPGDSLGLGAHGVLALSALLGGLLIGSVNNAMILGHFYLMIRGLPLEALTLAGRTVAAAVLAKMLLFGLALAFWDGAYETLLGQELVWTAWRVMFGFVGPLVLLWMVKDTVRLKHTQAATGLLYVAVGFALMGELAAVYLELATGLPA